MDMRAMNGKTKYLAFVPFWEELKMQMESYKTVHSRRHGGKHLRYSLYVNGFTIRYTFVIQFIVFTLLLI